MPIVTVVGIVTDLHKRKVMVLLTPREVEPYKGKWSLPIFHIDRYESVKDAVQREVKEITGLNYKAHFFGYFDEIIQSDEIHAVVLVFECLSTEQLIGENHEVEDLNWFSIEEASKLPLAFEHNKILDAYTDKRKEGVLRYLAKYSLRYLAGWIGIKVPIPKRIIR